MTTQELIQYLEKNKLTLSTVESFTGGKFASEITKIPGASKVFKGTLVAYSNEVKSKFLKLKKNQSPYNDKFTSKMAIEGKKIFKTDICISFCGIAGPNNPTTDLKVGTYFISMVDNEGVVVKKYISILKYREAIINEAINNAIRLVLKK